MSVVCYCYYDAMVIATTVNSVRFIGKFYNQNEFFGLAAVSC